MRRWRCVQRERLRGLERERPGSGTFAVGIVRERKPDVRRRFLVDRPCALPADAVDAMRMVAEVARQRDGLRHPSCAGASPRSGSSAAPADTRRTLARHRPRAPRPTSGAARRRSRQRNAAIAPPMSGAISTCVSPAVSLSCLNGARQYAAAGLPASVGQVRRAPCPATRRRGSTIIPMSEPIATQVNPISTYFADHLRIRSDDADRLAGLPACRRALRELRLHVGMRHVAEMPHRCREIRGADEQRVHTGHLRDRRQLLEGGERLDLQHDAQLGRGILRVVRHVAEAARAMDRRYAAHAVRRVTRGSDRSFRFIGVLDEREHQ